jgi:3-phosphoshikimate 1-carboxyvinyltransferase
MGRDEPRVLPCAVQELHGVLEPPPDKSITHRALLLGLLAPGRSRISNPLRSDDTRATMRFIQALGARIEEVPEGLVIHGPGLGRLHEPDQVIDCGNSGTTMRLAAGIAATLPGLTVLTGDESLRRRPMERIAEPLRLMGARVLTRSRGRAPLAVRGGHLRGIDYPLPVASAQVKSAILLAGLAAETPTRIRQPAPSRDHSERMLAARGIDISVQGLEITLEPGQSPEPGDLRVPGDISSAAFFCAAASILPRAELRITNVGLNPTRDGFLRALLAMGAHIEQENVSLEAHEPVGDLVVQPARLQAITLEAHEVPSLIDEIPLLAIVATQAHGATHLRGVGELRHKESDRLLAITSNLQAMGAQVEAAEDELTIHGPTPLQPAALQSFQDHRIIMAFTIAALLTPHPCTIDDTRAVSVSYPSFFQDLRRLTRP